MGKDFFQTDNEKKYADIFNMPRHVSRAYPKMSAEDRAMQFGSFEALVGFEDEIDETARITDDAYELSEDQKAEINERLKILNACAEAEPAVKITYFVFDAKKEGGMYVCATGKFKRFDEIENCVVINERSKIPTDSVIKIESPIID